MGKNYKEFKYNKNGEITDRRIVVLNQDDDHIAGIDIDRLDPTERDEYMKVVDAMQEATSKVMGKAFRNFKKASIVD